MPPAPLVRVDKGELKKENLEVRNLLAYFFRAALMGAGLYASLFLVSNYLGPIKLSLNNKNIDQKTLFTVDGEGTISVKPDLAVLSLGFTTQSPTVTIGQKQANEVINRLAKSLKELGLADKDLQTTGYNIYPNYNYLSGKPTLNGFSININLSVKVRDFEKLNLAIDQATADGINQVGGISFEVEKKDEFQNQARRLAIKNAQEKAQKIAGQAGIKLGRVVNVREESLSAPRPLLALTKATADGVNSETQVQPGSAEIKVNVSLDYETL